MEREHLRILVAEDDALVAMSLKETLIEMGHEVPWIARTGPEALTLAGKYRPDLVTMDGQLACGTSGVIAASAISGTLGIPVVMVSGHLDHEAARNSGAVALVSKPFAFHDIQNAVNAVYSRAAQA